VTCVTGLKLLDLDGRRCILVASGSSLEVHGVESGARIGSKSVLTAGSVHGFDVRDELVLVYGQRQACLCNLGSLEVEFNFGFLVDLVWEGCWVDETHIAFGFAQGYVDIWEKSGSSWVLEHRVLSKARCILYALAFAPRPSLDSLWVASGTVFGNIVLWKSGLAVPKESEGKVVNRLVGHRGPIFRVTWSPDAKCICSVGDDRTVRLWKRTSDVFEDFHQVWSMFGHGARIWDCAFVNNAIVSVGEDKQMRFWAEESGELLAILEAHYGRNVWRCCVSDDGKMIATGGGDSSIKLWDVDREIKSRIELKSLLKGPSVSLTNSTANGDSKRRKVSTGKEYIVSIQEIGSLNLLALTSDGILFLVNGLEASSPWVEVVRLGVRPVLFEISKVSGHAVELCVGAGSGELIFVSVDIASKKGTALFSFKAYEKTCVKMIHFACVQDRSMVYTSSVDGKLALWERVGNVLHQTGILTPTAVKPKVICSVVTVLDRHIVCGDIRGNMHCSALGNPATACETLMHIHGETPLSCLEFHDGFLFSGGFNGMVLKFQVSETNDGKLELIVVNIYKLSHFVMSLSHIKWSERNTMIVAGHNYNDFVVWDVDDRYLLLRERCGTNKRSGAFYVSSNLCVYFFAESSKEKKEREDGNDAPLAIRRIGRKTTPGLTLKSYTLGENFHSRSIWTTQFLPAPFSDVIFTGCEDGSMKLSKISMPPDSKGLLSLDQVSLENTVPGNCFRDVVTLKVVSDTTLTDTVRSACFSTNGTSTVLVTGGAEQIIRCWLLTKSDGGKLNLEFLCQDLPWKDIQDHTQRILGVTAFCSDPHKGAFGRHTIIAGTSMGQALIYTLVSKSTTGNSCTEPQDSSRLGSDGKMDPLLPTRAVLSRTMSMFESEDFPKKPVRSLSTCKGVVALGRTNGFVQVASSDGTLCLSVQMHAMGVNCIHICERSDSFMVCSGGDCQSLGLFFLDKSSLRLVAQPIRIENADGSALRGLFTDGKFIWTAGINQRLRMWKVELDTSKLNADVEQVVEKVNVSKSSPVVRGSADAVSVTLKADVVLDVADVNSLDVSSSCGRLLVAVGGTGLNVVSFSIKDKE